MGQKVNPLAFRLGERRNWTSRWYAKDRDYKALLLEDIKIRDLTMKKLKGAGISKVFIERSINQIKVTVRVSRPGVVIGRGGSGVEELRKEVGNLTKQKVRLEVQEIKKPELDAYLVARDVADQIEKRMPVKRILNKTVERVKQAGAKGVKILVSGRLGGAEIARREKDSYGGIPLQTLRADIDFAIAPARTATAGVVGVKVWIYKGEAENNQNSDKENTR